LLAIGLLGILIGSSSLPATRLTQTKVNLEIYIDPTKVDPKPLLKEISRPGSRCLGQQLS
jgi:hypothetical protein